MNIKNKVFTGYYDNHGNPINAGNTVQWGVCGKFYVFHMPHANDEWGMINIAKLPYWDGKTADYFLSVFDDDKDRQLKLIERV